ncbi:hypothetical protein E2562_035267 [Oryza meyeriana var. granulata]|uniref:Uncharacterized protein n=1 Tax=Oryza meyeriana var. granulata TaxID=110450 RepID=A0A6G1F1S6_9ORYZ|nr:hypothetical protein E2562_035267 [Oryza meyeriana var. granulata]
MGLPKHLTIAESPRMRAVLVPWRCGNLARASASRCQEGKRRGGGPMQAWMCFSAVSGGPSALAAAFCYRGRGRRGGIGWFVLVAAAEVELERAEHIASPRLGLACAILCEGFGEEGDQDWVAPDCRVWVTGIQLEEEAISD